MEIDFRGISKAYPGVRALEDVSFSVAAGSCHALMGENGAGKSTLGKILAGLISPDNGRLHLDGKEVQFVSPRDAIAAGVGIVHQELFFCPDLSIAENLCLHDLPRTGIWLDRKRLIARATELLARVKLAVDPSRRLGDLSLAQEQLVQIAAAVGLGAKVLVFDEPTSSLGRAETENLFALIRELQSQGTTIIYVSHRLEEVFSLCQSVTVLRDGKHVTTTSLRELDPAGIVRLMVGRTIDPVVLPELPINSRAPRIKVTDLKLPGHFEAMNFEIAPGEILGLAGLVGAGRSEVGETIAGLHPSYQGRIELNGIPLRSSSVQQAMSNGIGLVPEDRKRMGLVLGMSIRENVSLTILDRIRRLAGWLDQKTDRQTALSASEKLSIRAPNSEVSVNTLSGGNQQKVVFTRGWTRECQLLVIDEPTRGVDVAAKREIHDLIVEFSRNGTSILLISSDLPELLALSHRILVLRQGRAVTTIDRMHATEERVAGAMTGVQ